MTEPTINHHAVPADIETVLADGRPAIRCGCGLLIVSDDAYRNLEAFQEHDCPLTPRSDADADEPWYSYVFSFWGLLIAIVIAWTVLAALGKGSPWTR